MKSTEIKHEIIEVYGFSNSKKRKLLKDFIENVVNEILNSTLDYQLPVDIVNEYIFESDDNTGLMRDLEKLIKISKEENTEKIKENHKQFIQEITKDVIKDQIVININDKGLCL